MGCETCHGSSDEHCDDEEHITPPEIMYPRKKINAACLGCHVDIKPTEDEAKWAALMGANVCTNCHGRHRLTSRKRVWDKTTGKVLE